MDSMRYHNSIYFNFEKVQVGDEVAIDNTSYRGIGETHFTYQFGTVTRITKFKCIVTVKNHAGFEVQIEYSRITGEAMGAHKTSSRFNNRTLVTAARARENIASMQARRELRQEYNSIKDDLKKLAEGNWEASSLQLIDEVKARIETFMAK